MLGNVGLFCICYFAECYLL